MTCVREHLLSYQRLQQLKTTEGCIGRTHMVKLRGTWESVVLLVVLH